MRQVTIRNTARLLRLVTSHAAALRSLGLSIGQLLLALKMLYPFMPDDTLEWIAARVYGAR